MYVIKNSVFLLEMSLQLKFASQQPTRQEKEIVKTERNLKKLGHV